MKTHYRLDYRPPAFTLNSIDLIFDIHEQETLVKSRLMLRRQSEGACVLHGSAELISLTLDGKKLLPTQYSIDTTNDTLTLLDNVDQCILEVETRIEPHKNLSLMGLYQSRQNLFTQCEPEGFRKITYSLDRPDVMARYTVTLIADKQKFPVLLSNGNCVAQGVAGKQRHWAKWVDPYRKPSYLFAMVAGQLEKISDTFTTASGRIINLEIYVEARDLDKTAHAMRSLKAAMRWDEARFGLEYDLDTYMIVAVSDFNMGAMENKGLNIFNTRYVLANPQTASDADYEAIESVIAHEYFHNWTGNRVTCRDWFQLSLKEGLTVFRDQEFSADQRSRAVQRIEDVRRLRSLQFPEDAGPSAHAVRPDAYIEINNFYTMTVYEKGAEVVRMLQTILGKEGFAAGLREYLQKNDGKAATCDDFLDAMSSANDKNLDQMLHWYSQAGTPRVTVELQYSEKSQTATLTFTQSCPPTPKQAEKQPFLIPFRLALLDENGEEMPLFDHECVASEPDHAPSERLILLTKTTQRVTFYHVKTRPLPSLLRDFSAPVICDFDYSEADLAFLFQHDRDPFNRWEAGQRLMRNMLLNAIQNAANPASFDTQALEQAFIAILEDEQLDPAFQALALTLPSENELLELVPPPQNPVQISEIRETLSRQLAQKLYSHWLKTWRALQAKTSAGNDETQSGERRLKNIALAYLAQAEGIGGEELAKTQFQNAQNMTDKLGAILALRDRASDTRDNIFAEFAALGENEDLIIDKYFAQEAASTLPNALNRIQNLMQHPKFSRQNPNKVRAVLGSFAQNMRHFHDASGEAYRFFTEQIAQIDADNPQLAARLTQHFANWRRWDTPRQAVVRECLERLLTMPKLSRDSYEVISKTLAQ